MGGAEVGGVAGAAGGVVDPVVFCEMLVQAVDDFAADDATLSDIAGESPEELRRFLLGKVIALCIHEL